MHNKILFSLALIFALTVSLVSPSLTFAQGYAPGGEGGYSEENDEWLNEDIPSVSVYDPYENINRKIFNFNTSVQKNLFNPISYIYDAFIPKKIQGSISNFFSNIKMPGRFLNNLFQKKFKDSGIELSRFVINSTVGIGGLFDPAFGVFKLEPQKEDFGQTLGFYGVETGPYLVLPVFGPSTIRGVVGFVGDVVLNPLFWVSTQDWVEEDDLLMGSRYLNRVNSYSYHLRDANEKIRRDAIDPYISLQDFYMQHRKKLISQ